MNFTRTKTNKNQSKKNQSKVKAAFGKPAVFSYQETMSAGRRLEGVHQRESPLLYKNLTIVGMCVHDLERTWFLWYAVPRILQLLYQSY